MGEVPLWLALLIVAAVVAVSIAAKLLLRRFAPCGGFFTDSDRAAGVFGVLGTSFAVLLAFVIFLAFESFGNAREKAGQEAVAVAELFQTAQLFAPRERRQLHADLVCYARAVIKDEWRTMRKGRSSELVQRWVTRLEDDSRSVTISSPKQSIALAHWFDSYGERLEGRRGRLAEASPFVPPLLWVVLILAGVLVLLYQCLFADPGEPLFVQTLMIGAVAAIVASGLLTVRFLDRPYDNVSGSIKPSAMSRSLGIIERDWVRFHASARIPCNERGVPA
jgi:hypothetical protein